MLMLIGEADDYVKPEACRYTCQLMKQQGANVKLISYLCTTPRSRPP